MFGRLASTIYGVSSPPTVSVASENKDSSQAHSSYLKPTAMPQTENKNNYSVFSGSSSTFACGDSSPKVLKLSKPQNSNTSKPITLYHCLEDLDRAEITQSCSKKSLKSRNKSSVAPSTQTHSIDTIPKIDPSEMIRIVCVSDTHAAHKRLSDIPNCDIFIHAGDILLQSNRKDKTKYIPELQAFNTWLGKVPAKNRLVLCGNHDAACESLGKEMMTSILTNGTYLHNTYTEIEGLKIFGTPFSSGRSSNKAFQSDRFARETVSSLNSIPGYSREGSCGIVDILITHGPSHELTRLLTPRLAHFWGHVHEYYGLHYDAVPRNTLTRIAETSSVSKLLNMYIDGDLTLMPSRYGLPNKERIGWVSACCCSMDPGYEIANLPVTIDIPRNLISQGKSGSETADTSTDDLTSLTQYHE